MSLFRKARARAEVRELVALGAEPYEVRVGQHGIQHHQSLDGTRKGHWTAQAAVWFADRAIDRLVLEVVQVRSPGGRTGKTVAKRRFTSMAKKSRTICPQTSPEYVA